MNNLISRHLYAPTNIKTVLPSDQPFDNLPPPLSQQFQWQNPWTPYSCFHTSFLRTHPFYRRSLLFQRRKGEKRKIGRTNNHTFKYISANVKTLNYQAPRHNVNLKSKEVPKTKVQLELEMTLKSHGPPTTKLLPGHFFLTHVKKKLSFNCQIWLSSSSPKFSPSRPNPNPKPKEVPEPKVQ